MEDTLLATLPLEDTEITYTIYLYIDSTISLGNYNDKTYSGYIYATTEQTSTVGKEEDNTNQNLGLQTVDFDYLGSEQQFIVPETGTYQLETWGAQGGSAKTSFGNIYHGGYGGYSYGVTILNKNQLLFLNIGGKGIDSIKSDTPSKNGGYNGGGNSAKDNATSGGGATHIASVSGVLYNLSTHTKNILIVSGSGGGACADLDGGGFSMGGNGGGASGTDAEAGNNSFEEDGKYQVGLKGTQKSGYKFGIGESGESIDNDNNRGKASGGGSGFFGGTSGNGTTWNGAAGGGSGYIGNSQLTNKAMYCYNCEESTEESTKTISTTNVSEIPISKYAKKGNGYARITIINE